MQQASTRRHFIQIFPLAGMTMIAACSDKPAPAPEPTPAPVAPPPPAPAPAPEPAAAPASAVEPAAAPAQPAAPAAPAQSSGALPMADEKDAQAQALGYVSDASRADKVQYTKFVPGSQCSNCGLFQGKPGDAAGGCPLFPGKQVAAKGWCSAWVKKA